VFDFEDIEGMCFFYALYFSTIKIDFKIV
jgi:hypothetical protein